MGIEADKESIGSIVWVDRCKFAQDRANEGDHNTSDIGVLWAEDHIATQAATIEALRGALLEAADEIECWGAYASEYFQEKHDLEGWVAKFKAIAKGDSDGR